MATKKRLSKAGAQVTEANAEQRLSEQLATLNARHHRQEQDDAIHGTSDVLTDQWRRERPDLDLRAFELGIRVRRLAMLLDERLAAICASLGVKMSDFLLLMALRRLGSTGSMRPTDIRRMHSVTSGTVTYRIDKLIQQDLVSRLQDPAYLRGYLIQLTSHGCDVVNRGVDALSRYYDATLSEFRSLAGATELFGEMLRHFELRVEEAGGPAELPCDPGE